MDKQPNIEQILLEGQQALDEQRRREREAIEERERIAGERWESTWSKIERDCLEHIPAGIVDYVNLERRECPTTPYPSWTIKWDCRIDGFAPIKICFVYSKETDKWIPSKFRYVIAERRLASSRYEEVYIDGKSYNAPGWFYGKQVYNTDDVSLALAIAKERFEEFEKQRTEYNEAVQWKNELIEEQQKQAAEETMIFDQAEKEANAVKEVLSVIAPDTSIDNRVREIVYEILYQESVAAAKKTNPDQIDVHWQIDEFFSSPPTGQNRTHILTRKKE